MDEMMNERVLAPARRLCRGLGCAVALSIALGATTVAAQTPGGTAQNGFSGSSMGFGPGMGRHQPGGQGQSGGQPRSPAPLPVVKAPWPRLDTGSILCKSREDLVAYQKRQAGEPASGPAPDCHIIQQMTPVQILDREGLASTHVALTDASKQAGWTDVYIPATPPH
jgi:hypothetical protein